MGNLSSIDSSMRIVHGSSNNSEGPWGAPTTTDWDRKACEERATTTVWTAKTHMASAVMTEAAAMTTMWRCLWTRPLKQYSGHGCHALELSSDFLPRESQGQ